MKPLVILLSLLGGFMALTACNTIEGIGEDLTAAGKAIDESAERNR